MTVFYFLSNKAVLVSRRDFFQNIANTLLNDGVQMGQFGG